MIKIDVDFDSLKNEHESKLYKYCKDKLDNILQNTKIDNFYKKYFEAINSNLKEILVGDKTKLEEIKKELDKFVNYKDLIKKMPLDRKEGKGAQDKNINSIKADIKNYYGIDIQGTTLKEIRDNATNEVLNQIGGKNQDGKLVIIEKTKEIFDYNGFTNGDGIFKEWNRHKVISKMGVEICPYCNRQYITKYYDKEEKEDKTTADLDHYYPKGKYPYLALSLYNFVPSCQICNSRMKKEQEGHLYPYEKGFGDETFFKTNVDIINGIMNTKSDKFEIEIEDKSNDIEVAESIKIFRLKEVYKNSHNKYILDMLQNIEHYPKKYLESIADFFENDEDKKLKQVEELREIIMKPYKDRVARNDTLAKLTKDILKEYNK